MASSLADASSVSVWKTRDRSFWILALLTVFTGLFGLDHFYLRSFKTGFLKIGTNLLLLGLWYFWDIAQLVSNHKDVQENGLRVPFAPDIRIGTGVVASPTEQPKPSDWNPPSASILIYALLAIMPITGFVGIDRIYAGSWSTAFMKFMLNIFLFGAWYFYDIYSIIVNEEKIVKAGLMNPPPIGGHVVAGVFLPTPIANKQPATLWQRLKKLIYSLLTLTDVASTVLSVAPAPIPQTVAAAKAQITTVVETAEAIGRVAEKGGRLLQKTGEMGPQIMDALGNRIQDSVTEIASAAITGRPEFAAAAAAATALHGVTTAQQGGAIATKTIGSSGAVILAVLTVTVGMGVYQIIKAATTATAVPDADSVVIAKLQHKAA